MNWEAIGAIAELLGAIGVIVGDEDQIGEGAIDHDARLLTAIQSGWLPSGPGVQMPRSLVSMPQTMRRKRRTMGAGSTVAPSAPPLLQHRNTPHWVVCVDDSGRAWMA